MPQTRSSEQLEFCSPGNVENKLEGAGFYEQVTPNKDQKEAKEMGQEHAQEFSLQLPQLAPLHFGGEH